MALVVLVAAYGRGLNLEMVEQLLRLAGVFAGDAVDALENVEGAEGDVAEVADGRGDEVEAGSERCVGWGTGDFKVRGSGRFLRRVWGITSIDRLCAGAGK
jgi:hypothetical protein